MMLFEQLARIKLESLPSMAFDVGAKQHGFSIFGDNRSFGELYDKAAEKVAYHGDWAAKAIAFRPILRHTKLGGENITPITNALEVGGTARSLRNYFEERGRFLVIIPYMKYQDMKNQDVSILLPGRPLDEGTDPLDFRQQEQLRFAWFYQEIMALRIRDANSYYDLRPQAWEKDGIYNPKYRYSCERDGKIVRTVTTTGAVPPPRL